MFRIARFASQFAAEQAAIYLREHGINAHVIGDLAHHVALSFTALKFGAHEIILLDAEQREDAEIVLQSFHEDAIELEEGWEAEAEIDVSHVDFTRFPIHCRQCKYDLTSAPHAQSCPHCDARFDAAALVLEQHGPEAFADEA